MSGRTSKITDIIVALAAVLAVIVLVHREYVASDLSTAKSKPEQIENWQDMLNSGVWFGPTSASVQIIEFADLQCPYCARFSHVVDSVRAKYPEEVALVFMHYPLAQHAHAKTAARAMECAVEQNAGEAFMRQVYSGQDSLGTATWEAYAASASVNSIASFSECMKSNRADHRIDAGLEWRRRLALKGTPTVVINGWVVDPDTTVIAVVDSLIAGHRPFKKSKRRTI